MTTYEHLSSKFNCTLLLTSPKTWGFRNQKKKRNRQPITNSPPPRSQNPNAIHNKWRRGETSVQRVTFLLFLLQSRKPKQSTIGLNQLGSLYFHEIFPIFFLIVENCMYYLHTWNQKNLKISTQLQFNQNKQSLQIISSN